MVDFSTYYLKVIWSLWENIIIFIKGIFSSFWKFLVTDVMSYFAEMAQASKNFDIFGWICLVFVTILNVTLLFFLVYRLYQVIRRWILYRSKEVEKDELVEQIARLKEYIKELVKEKNKIFAMKFDGVTELLEMNKNSLGKYTINGNDKNVLEIDNSKSGNITSTSGNINVLASSSLKGSNLVNLTDVSASRFSKLASIDNKYLEDPCLTIMQETDTMTLEQIVEHFINFSASQLNLYYNPQIIRTFFAGMGTSKVIILEGISGTGKTSLPYAMGKFFKNDTGIISVQPSWRDRADLLGYLNEFTKKFNETDFLKFVYEAGYRDDLSFIILDEMNLARIEYYFAEFLSIMEMPNANEWKIDLVPNTVENDPGRLEDGKLTVPQNLWFIGTANQDDSTFTITDKVYDRAISIEMSTKNKYIDVPLTEPMNCSYNYLEQQFEKALKNNKISEVNLNNIKELDEFMFKKFKVTFGNRILRQINTFIPIYMACGGTEIEALDIMLSSKILRKFKQLNLAFLVKELNELSAKLDKMFGKNACPLSLEYIKGLIANI